MNENQPMKKEITHVRSLCI